MKPIEEWSKKEKLNFLKDFIEGEDKFFNDYTEELTCLLKDSDAKVREMAVDALWTIPDESNLMTLRELSDKDPDPGVRIRAIGGLGRYMFELDDLICSAGFLDEFEEDDEIPQEKLEETKEYLIQLHKNPEKTMDEQRFALEALGFLDDEEIDGLIRQAYESEELLFKISAIFAMGRSGRIIWEDIVLKELHNTNKNIQQQAIKAAGELGLDEAGEDLLKFTYSKDRDIMEEAVWALGKTGWAEAFERLDELAMSRDNELRELAEAALDEWYMASGSYDDLEDEFQGED